MIAKEKYVEINWIRQQLDQLQPEQKPLWGMMTPQHMVEHLIVTFRISTGKITTKVYMPAEKVEKYKQYGLLSDQPFTVNFKNPILPKDTLPPTETESLEVAKDVLLKEVTHFHKYYCEHPENTWPHPVFGNLNYEEWKQFHYKHIHHHFRQFALIS